MNHYSPKLDARRDINPAGYGCNAKQLSRDWGGEKVRDETYNYVKENIGELRIISISAVQRRFRLGFNRAMHYLQYMEQDGIIEKTGDPMPRPQYKISNTDKCECCDRGDEYNGFGSDGPTTFSCPKSCPCHD
jgi:hypothetical protein